MKLNRQQLRKLINKTSQKIIEGCGDPVEMAPVVEEPAAGPCPYSTAEALKASGMSEAEVLQWVNTMLSSFLSAGDFDFTGDVGMLSGDEAFGIGYDAGTRGL